MDEVLHPVQMGQATYLVGRKFVGQQDVQTLILQKLVASKAAPPLDTPTVPVVQ